jgi:hypothetical protein
MCLGADIFNLCFQNKNKNKKKERKKNTVNNISFQINFIL